MTKKKPPAIRDRIVDFRRVPASSLIPNPSNWRTHPEEQRAALAGVLESVGIVDAVIARETPEGLELIDGHLRQETLTGDIPVIVVDLNDEEAAEVLATFDPLTALAGIDAGKLEGLLDGLTSESEAVDKMLADLKLDAGIFDEIDEDLDAEPQVDRADELREAWGTEAGQLWALGDHRVLCGDSTKAEDVERLMDGAKADMMFTDPPYGVDYSGGIQFQKDGTVQKNNREKLKGDDTAAIYAEFLPVAVSFVYGPCYMWFAASKARDVFNAVYDSKCEVHALIIWHKTNATYGAMNAQYKQRHEPCLYFKPNGSTLRWCGLSTEATVWSQDRDGINEFHPTQKPIALAAKAIGNHDAAEVYDPFLGSGTTLIAAEQLNRRCFGIEISPAYVAVILQRYADATGKQPTLIEGE